MSNYLRSLGFDVKHVAEIKKSLKDEDILKLAFREARILLTKDKDFSLLVYFRKLNHKGVVLLKFNEQKTNVIINYFKIIIGKFNFADFKNKFVIISEKGVKINE